ncbi:mucin-2-like [Branchiostoma lanceolatum]|uniref:mucin-2-like n=1 Tax=Branchiostoma lanceolatum TaxID=7740 RepID=UPI00345655A8
MPFGESCYHYETEEPTDKDSAETICQQGGGSLVSISSSDEYGMIMDEYEEKTYYLGATWINDAWAWDSGSTDGLDLLTSLNAPDGSDTQRCLMMRNGDLTATDCDTAREFLCETPGEQGEEDEDDESARENGYDICETPMDIECRLVGTDYVLGNGGISDDGLTECTLEYGAQCEYNCSNYEVRYRCCYEMHECTTPGPTTPAPTTAAPTTAAPTTSAPTTAAPTTAAPTTAAPTTAAPTTAAPTTAAPTTAAPTTAAPTTAAPTTAAPTTAAPTTAAPTTAAPTTAAPTTAAPTTAAPTTAAPTTAAPTTEAPTTAAPTTAAPTTVAPTTAAPTTAAPTTAAPTTAAPTTAAPTTAAPTTAAPTTAAPTTEAPTTAAPTTAAPTTAAPTTAAPTTAAPTTSAPTTAAPTTAAPTTAAPTTAAPTTAAPTTAAPTTAAPTTEAPTTAAPTTAAPTTAAPTTAAPTTAAPTTAAPTTAAPTTAAPTTAAPTTAAPTTAAPTTAAPTTAAPTTAAPTTAAPTTTAYCVPVCIWTGFMNGGAPDPNDDETYDTLRQNYTFCEKPSKILCRDRNAPNVYMQPGNGVTCDVDNGLYCDSSKKTTGCRDYEINVQCCELPAHCVTTLRPTTKPATTTAQTTPAPTTAAPTTAAPTTAAPTTAAPTTAAPTTAAPTTAAPTTAAPTTAAPTTAAPTTAAPTTAAPTTAAPTTAAPTTAAPTTAAPTTAAPTTAAPTTAAPTTAAPTTAAPTTAAPTTAAPTTAAPTTAAPTTAAPTTEAPTTAAPTTAAPTTAAPTTAAPTTAAPTTAAPTTAAPTTAAPTTLVPTTAAPATTCPDVCNVMTLPYDALLPLFQMLGGIVATIPFNTIWTVGDCKTYTCSDCGVVVVDNPECPPLLGGLCANGKIPLYFSDGCCVHYSCGCECIGWGDPHYQGMDGGYFPFQGAGDYILSASTADNLFAIIGTNVDCSTLPNANFFYHKSPYGPNDVVTCTAAVTLLYGGHSFKVVYQGLQMFIDGQPTGWGTYNVAGVKAIKQFGNPNVWFWIEEYGIFVQYSHLGYKVTIRIEPGDLAAHGIHGLCGTCNNNQTDDCLETNPEQCACEYLVENGLAHKNECISTSPPPPNENCTELADVCDEYLSADPTENALLEECFKYVDPETFRRACRYDVYHCVSECQSIETFVTTCFEEARRHNDPICIDWRIELPHCSLNCSGSLVERSCTCQRTCDNPTGHCDANDMIQDACFCPDGYVLDEETNQCVPEEECLHCVDDQGNHVAVNSTWVPGGDSCQICTCYGPNNFECDHVYCDPYVEPVCEGYCKILKNVENFDPCCPEYECVCENPCEPPDVPVCGYGHVPINVQEPDDCAPVYDCICDTSTCDPTMPVCNPFEELQETPTDCCSIYTCVCVDCPLPPNITCEAGYEVVEVPFNFGCNCTTNECEPLPDYCIYEDSDFVDYIIGLGIPLPPGTPMPTPTFYLPGDVWTAAFECVQCTCLEAVEEENHEHGGTLHQIECYPTEECNTTCPMPCMTYVPSNLPGVCCGQCEEIPCCVVDLSGEEIFHDVSFFSTRVLLIHYQHKARQPCSRPPFLISIMRATPLVCHASAIEHLFVQ